MGVTLALRQSSGTIEVVSDLFKIMVRIGPISVENCFKVWGNNLSGPTALCGLRFTNNLITPEVVIVMFGISELLLLLLLLLFEKFV